MIKTVDLLAYLPPKIQEYFEIQEITRTENPEFQIVWNASDQMKKDLFILTAEEQGLRRFERIMGIFPSEQDTFESRRMRILTRWNDARPYTFRYLWGMLEVITGGNFNIITNFNEYEMEIITHIGHFGGVEDLRYLLQTVIPANLIVISNNVLDVESTGNLRLASAIIPTMVYMVTNDFEADYEITGTAAHRATLVQSSVVMVTNDFEAIYTAEGRGNTGAIMEVVSEFLITNDFEAVVSVDGSAKNRSATILVTEYQI
jgi:hypothetical protein